MSRSPKNSSRSRPQAGDPLTDREVQILSLVAAGEPTPAISVRLGIAENTIKTHLTSVYKKTGSINRVQAARHYLDHYTVPASASDPAPPLSVAPVGVPGPAGDASLIARQINQIQTRLEQLAPATTEADRLHHALDALRAIEPH